MCAIHAHVQATGSTVVLNLGDQFGDQFGDLEGGYAERAVKLPNPGYYRRNRSAPGAVERLARAAGC